MRHSADSGTHRLSRFIGERSINMSDSPGAKSTKTLPAFQRHTPDWKQILERVAAYRNEHGEINWNEIYWIAADGACGTLEDIEHFQHPSVIVASRNSYISDQILSSLTHNARGHTNLIIVGGPGVQTPILAVMGNEVTIEGASQVPLVFGAAQKAYADAITFLCELNILPRDTKTQQNLIIYVQCYVDKRATEAVRVYDNAVSALVNAVVCAVTGGTTHEQALAAVANKHPFCDVEPQKLPEGLTPLPAKEESEE